LANFIAAFKNDPITTIGNALKTAVEVLATPLVDVLSLLGELPGELGDFFSGIGTSLKEGIEGIPEKFKNTLNSITSSFANVST
jgi:hypothetical protein